MQFLQIYRGSCEIPTKTSVPTDENLLTQFSVQRIFNSYKCVLTFQCSHWLTNSHFIVFVFSFFFLFLLLGILFIIKKYKVKQALNLFCFFVICQTMHNFLKESLTHLCSPLMQNFLQHGMLLPRCFFVVQSLSNIYVSFSFLCLVTCPSHFCFSKQLNSENLLTNTSGLSPFCFLNNTTCDIVVRA